MAKRTKKEKQVAEQVAEDKAVATKAAKKSKKAKEAKPKAPKLTPEERRAKRDADDLAIRKAGGVVRNAAGRLTARGLTCLCGCGQATVTYEAKFVSGHDAKLRKRLLEGEEIPAIILPFFEVEGTVIAGLALEGGEIVDMRT